MTATARPGTRGDSTPIPWRNRGTTITAVDAHGMDYPIAFTSSVWVGRTQVEQANAALIVKAVNHFQRHDALIEALRETLDCLINETAGQKDTPWVSGVKNRARAALKLVEE